MYYFLTEHKILLAVVGGLWAAGGCFSLARLAERGEWREVGEGLRVLGWLLFKFFGWPVIAVYGGYLAWQQAHQHKVWFVWGRYYVKRLLLGRYRFTRENVPRPLYHNWPERRAMTKKAYPTVRKVQANMLWWNRRRWERAAEAAWLNGKGNPHNYLWYTVKGDLLV